MSSNGDLVDEDSWLARWFDGSNLVLSIDDLVLYVDGVFAQQQVLQVVGWRRQDRVGHDAHGL